MPGEFARVTSVREFRFGSGLNSEGWGGRGWGRLRGLSGLGGEEATP